MKKLLAILLGIVVALSAAGCSSGGTEQSPAASNESQQQTNDESSNPTTDDSDSGESSGDGPFSVGVKYSARDFSVVVNSVRRDEGGDFTSPDYDFYLVLDVTIENFTDESESLSSLLQTELQGSDDYMYDQALFVDTRGSLDGDIPAGGSLRGEIAFDVPELDGYIFLYQPDLFSDSIPFIIYASDIGTGSSTVEESAESSAGFGVGDTISDDDFRITLNRVRTLDEDSFGSSPDNDLFLILDVTIENLEDEETNVSSILSLSLRGSDAYEYDQAIFVETKGSLDGSIRSGGKLRGEIAYDVPTLNFYEFTYEHSLFGGSGVTFVVNSADLG